VTGGGIFAAVCKGKEGKKRRKKGGSRPRGKKKGGIRRLRSEGGEGSFRKKAGKGNKRGSIPEITFKRRGGGALP